MPLAIKMPVIEAIKKRIAANRHDDQEKEITRKARSEILSSHKNSDRQHRQ